jgi:Na+/H+ antiporter NhaD/arsenite permease-like protein
MLLTSNPLATGEAGRAAIVGWAILAAFILFVVVLIVVGLATGSESFFDWLATRIPKHSPGRPAMLVSGLALVALGFVFASFGIAIIGAILLFCFWRIYERNIY